MAILIEGIDLPKIEKGEDLLAKMENSDEMY